MDRIQRVECSFYGGDTTEKLSVDMSGWCRGAQEFVSSACVPGRICPFHNKIIDGSVKE